MTGNGGISERPKQNPLTVDLILKTTFEHLPLKDLAKCRLVSRQWYHESQSIWRDNATLRFRSGKFFDGKGVESTYTVNFAEFLAFWEGIRDWKPYRKFLLQGWNATSTAKLNSDDVTRFWGQIGSHVTALTLLNHVFTNAREVRQVMYQACPNLQSLTMDGCEVMDSNNSMQRTYNYRPPPRASYVEDDDGDEGGEDDTDEDDDGGQNDDDEDETRKEPDPIFSEHTHLRSLIIKDCLPDSWLELLSHFPFINSLTFTPEADADPLINLKLLQAIQHVRKQNPLNLPLDQFNVPFALEDDFFEGLESFDMFVLLRKLQLPLKHFQLFLYDDTDPDHIKSIVQDHAHTIRKIEGYQEESVPCAEFPFGVELPNLKVLNIYFGNCFDNLHFLKFMPNMRRLYISDHFNETPFANTSEVEMTGVALPKLAKLTLNFKVTEENMRSLIRWMPNMKKLSVPLDDNVLAVVCGGWKDLIELSISGDRLTNEGVTGRVAGEEEARPNLTHLTKLTDLNIWGGNLTEASVLQGFLKMPSLKRLVLRGRQSSRIRRGGKADTALRAKVLLLDQPPRAPQDSDNEDSDLD